MEIKVSHKVPYSEGLETKCFYPGDFFGNDVCKYHKLRDRTHGRKAPVERRVPKCALFDKWLPGEYDKCAECLEACRSQSKEVGE